MKIITKTFLLFTVGGILYYGIEYFYKTFISHNNTHWSMFLLGGICFILVGAINEVFSWETPLFRQGGIGAILITLLEFIFGFILNIILKLNIWDYSSLPFNILGQVCLPFSLIWFLLAILAIFLDDFLRW